MVSVNNTVVAEKEVGKGILPSFLEINALSHSVVFSTVV